MNRQPASRALILGAFAIVYVVWGSTYLAIRVAIETVPPFYMAGTRFLLAGALLYGWARMRGAARPERAALRGSAILGVLFLCLGNGGLVWSETRVPSGLAAVLVATVPLWTVLIERFRGAAVVRPAVWAGLAIGLCGVVLLMAPGRGEAAIDPIGAAVLIVASIIWAYGIVISRSLALPDSGAMNAAVQMLVGGACLLAAGTLVGEPSSFQLAAVSGRSLIGLAYLVVFGSLIAFSAFVWLLREVPPGRVATYAYVNPVVAVLLGWQLAAEPFGPRELVASAVILAGVALIISVRSR